MLSHTRTLYQYLHYTRLGRPTAVSLMFFVNKENGVVEPEGDETQEQTLVVLTRGKQEKAEKAQS